MSLDRHINLGWQGYLCRELGEFIDVVPPQQRIDEHWYQGTADAVYQNIYTIEKERPAYVVILAGDHIYKMDYMKLVERHIETKADLTIGCAAGRSPPGPATRRHADRRATSRVIGFEEKPEQPKPIPGDPAHALGSMGIYVFTARFLFEQLCLDATRHGSKHDFGRDVHPLGDPDPSRLRLPVPRREPQEGRLLAGRGHAGRLLRGQHGPGDGRSATEPLRPSLADPHLSAQLAAAEVRLRRSAVRRPAAARPWTASSARARSFPAARSSARSSAPTPRINSYAQVEDSILFDGVNVGRHAKIRRAIIDKEVDIPAGHRDRLQPRPGPLPRLHHHRAAASR